MDVVRALPAIGSLVVAVVACSGGPSPTNVSLGTPNAGEGAAPRTTAGPATIACGSATCRAPDEVCCVGDAPRCVAAPAADAEPLRWLGAVADACRARGSEGFASIAACDDSGDCGAGKRCCEQYVASGADTYRACAASCDVHEACVEGKPCAAAGAACVDGTCAMPPEKRRCGKSQCTKERPFCCGDDEATAVCAAGAACEGKHRFECGSPRDCVEGACQRNVMGDTYCTLLVDIANAGLVCERDADCDDSICMGSPGKGSCDVEERSCTCKSP